MRTDQIKAALISALRAVESLEAKGCNVVQVSIGNFHPVIQLADMPQELANKPLEPIQVKEQGQLLTIQTLIHKDCLVTWPAQQAVGGVQ